MSRSGRRGRRRERARRARAGHGYTVPGGNTLPGRPNLARLFAVDLNGKGADSVRANSSETAWWKGAFCHGWDDSVSAAVAASGRRLSHMRRQASTTWPPSILLWRPSGTPRSTVGCRPGT